MPNDLLHCRRPYCATLFTNEAARNRHEADKLKHNKVRDQMNYICDEPGHYDAIAEHGYCPVCQ